MQPTKALPLRRCGEPGYLRSKSWRVPDADGDDLHAMKAVYDAHYDQAHPQLAEKEGIAYIDYKDRKPPVTCGASPAGGTSQRATVVDVSTSGVKLSAIPTVIRNAEEVVPDGHTLAA